MTGTGTQTDPYIVDNWIDLVAANNKSGTAYIKFADGGGVIDMNEAAPYGVSNVFKSDKYIDGNGWIIKNIHTTGEFSYAKSVSNLTLLNVYAENDFIYGYNLSNCIITGKFGGRVIFSGYSVNVDRCSFNIDCFGSSSTLTETDHYSSRYIKFNHCIIKFSNASFYQKKFVGTNFDHCTITGNTNQTGSCFNSCSVYNSIFDIEAPNMEMTLNGGSGICIANTEKAPNVSVSGIWKGVTTAQMSDAEYLAGIGFPIGVE